MRKDKVVSEVFGEEIALTPSDLYSKQFKSKLIGGYNPHSVHQFLERIADVLEDLIVQVRVLKEQVSQQNERLDEYRQMEGTLRNALISSRNFGEDILESAKREAHTLVEEARLVKAKAHLEAAKIPGTLSRDIQLLDHQRHRLRAEIISILETHRRLLDSLVPEPVSARNLAMDVASSEVERLIGEAERLIEPEQDASRQIASEPEPAAADTPDEPEVSVTETPIPTVEPDIAMEDSDFTPEDDEDIKAAAGGIMLSKAERALLTDSDTLAANQPAESDDASTVVLGEPVDESSSDSDSDSDDSDSDDEEDEDSDEEEDDEEEELEPEESVEEEKQEKK